MTNQARRTQSYRIVHRQGAVSKVRKEDFDAHLKLGNLIQTTEQCESYPRAAYVHPGLVAMLGEDKALSFIVALRASVAEIAHRLINTFNYAETLAKEVARAIIWRRDSSKKPLCLGENVWDIYVRHIVNSVEDPEKVNMRCLLGMPRILGEPVVPGDPVIFLPDGKTRLEFGSRMVIW